MSSPYYVSITLYSQRVKDCALGVTLTLEEGRGEDVNQNPVRNNRVKFQLGHIFSQETPNYDLIILQICFRTSTQPIFKHTGYLPGKFIAIVVTLQQVW